MSARDRLVETAHRIRFDAPPREFWVELDARSVVVVLLERRPVFVLVVVVFVFLVVLF